MGGKMNWHFCMTCERMRWFNLRECKPGVFADEKTRLKICDVCGDKLEDSRARELLEEKSAEINDLLEQISIMQG